MERIRREKNQNYTTISNVFLRDLTISYDAKGFLATVMSLPDNWDFSVSGMVSISLEGRNAVYRIIKELITAGYCERTYIYTYDNGKKTRCGVEYVFLESPKNKNNNDLNPRNLNLDNLNLDNLNLDFGAERSTDSKEVQIEEIKDENKDNVPSLKNEGTMPLPCFVDDSGIILHTCENKELGNLPVLAQEVEAGVEYFKIMPNTQKRFDNLSKTKQAQVNEVIRVFVSVTGKEVALTKDRLGLILLRLSEQTIRNGSFVNVEPIHFKAVFEYKEKQWRNDSNMSAYIRLETLCNGKFHIYIDEAREAYKKTKKKQSVVESKKTRMSSIG